jgi:hypothetical protein
MTDIRTPEQVEVDRQLFIAIGKAEELAAKRDALRGQAPLTAATYDNALPHAARMATTHGRTSPSPDASTGARPVPLVAAASAAGVDPGDVLADKEALARVTCDVLQGLDRNRPPSGPSIVARARWADRYPVERRLSMHDPWANRDKVDAVCAPQAIVASGGVCLPTNVDFSVPVFATADRPLRDNLPPFQADRGGLRFVTPPDIGVPSLQATASGLGSATGVWTEATDASPSGQTKPVFQVSCGAEQLVYVNAIPTRVGFGNMQGRFAPEQVAANTDVAISVAAREAELELLTLMYNASKQVQPDQYLGAARDLMATVDLLLEQYRYSHRIPDSAVFTAVFPSWAKGLIRADLVREVAHDNAGSMSVWSITDAQIEGWFSDRNIRPIWTLDALKAGTYGSGSQAITDQWFPVVTAGSGELVWPGQSADAAFRMAWLLYPEGTFQFLDGGRLDLGVVRDSTLDATNDYETFTEVFESVAMRGLECYQVQSLVLPNGGSAGTVAVTGYEQ